jgi:CDP-paratose 2-epimerase
MSAPPTGSQPILVTGGAGFIGCNLADRLASEGHPVLILDSLARPGVERNAGWLEARHPGRIRLLTEDIRDARIVHEAVRCSQAVFHFAAQVAVTSSLLDPAGDFAINLQGTLNVLEALRAGGAGVPLILASTNKVYGDLADIPLSVVEEAYQPDDEILRGRGISEDRPLDFHTPYGCSKGGADQYVLDYARSFGIPAAVMRMSCIYGDGRQVRDILFVDDAVDAYVQAWRQIDRIKGRAFNLGGGPANALSLRQLLAHIESLLGRGVAATFHEWRAGDQRYYVSDTRRVVRELGLAPPLPWRSGVTRLAEWLRSGDAEPRRRVVEA